MIIKELITRFGFEVDEPAIKRFEDRINNLDSRLEEFKTIGRDISAEIIPSLDLTGASFVDLSSNAEEIKAKFDSVFRELSPDVRAWANAMSSELGDRSAEFERFVSKVQESFIPLGFAQRQAADMSKTIVALGADLSTFYNIARPDAINIVTSAITGSTEAIRRLGIEITNTAMNQELLNAGIKGGADSASAQELAVSRMNIILRATRSAQGAAIETSELLSREMRSVQETAASVEAQFNKIPSTKVVNIDTIVEIPTIEPVVSPVEIPIIEPKVSPKIFKGGRTATEAETVSKSIKEVLTKNIETRITAIETERELRVPTEGTVFREREPTKQIFQTVSFQGGPVTITEADNPEEFRRIYEEENARMLRQAKEELT